MECFAVGFPVELEKTIKQLELTVGSVPYDQLFTKSR